MKNVVSAKLLYKCLALGGLSLCLWAVSARTKEQQDKFIPVVITDQLPAKAGVIPVFMSCGQARLSSANRIEEFSCTFKNDTNLKITAANVIASIILDSNGSTSTDPNNYTVTALVHRDFRSTSKLIGPGDEISVGPPGPITYSKGTVIKSIEIKIDYVEFDNGTTLGPDNEGSRIVNGIRAGAEKYKGWLKLQYERRGKSIAAVAPDIETTQALPADFPTDANGQVGAREYRRQLQKVLNGTGPSEVKKLLAAN